MNTKIFTLLLITFTLTACSSNPQAAKPTTQQLPDCNNAPAPCQGIRPRREMSPEAKRKYNQAVEEGRVTGEPYKLTPEEQRQSVTDGQRKGKG